MTWAQRLKRVFNIDIETCKGCGGGASSSRMPPPCPPCSQLALYASQTFRQRTFSAGAVAESPASILTKQCGPDPQERPQYVQCEEAHPAGDIQRILMRMISVLSNLIRNNAVEQRDSDEKNYPRAKYSKNTDELLEYRDLADQRCQFAQVVFWMAALTI
jgi:hypothetical protein